MTYFGNLRVNPNPCTEQDQRRNWDIANQLFETIIDQGTVDNYTVCVDTSDTEPAFLNDKLYNQGAYLDGTHQLVYADIYVDAGVRKVRLFTAAAAAAGADNYKVKSSGTDTTDEYLHDAIADAAAGGTYSSGADILVKAETIDAGAGNLRERLFADMSTKTGYSLTVTRVFACVSGNTRFIDLSNFYSELWAALGLVRLTFADETLTADQQYQMLRGQCTANVLAGDASFSIDQIHLLSDCLDPRGTPGDMNETLLVHKEDVKVTLRNNDWITAVRNDTDSQWELLCTERYRSIRGTWYSGTSTLVVNNIVVLGSGLDPRTDTTSTTETVNITNVASDTYSSGDKVYADWNAKDGVWEARPKGGGGSTDLAWGTITTEASAATVEGTPTDDGRVELFSGGTVTAHNYYPDDATLGAVACITGDGVLVTWSCGVI